VQAIDIMSPTEPTPFESPKLHESGFTLRMFGQMSLEGGHRLLTKFPTKRSALLLACLAVARGHKIGRDELAETLWPDDYLDLTRIRLRQELRRLRIAVGDFGTFISADRQWIEIEPGKLATDLQQFDDALGAATLAQSPELRVKFLLRAVSLLNGPVLGGFQEPWVHAIRRTYAEKARRAWLNLADTYQGMGEVDKALDATINAVRHDPLDTDANGALIRRLVDRGQGARARQVFLEFDAMIYRELGHHAPPFVRAPLIQAAGDSDDALAVPEQHTRNRVKRPSPIIGRDNLLESIENALSRPGACIALVGAVGIGKTHILRELAWRFAFANDLPVQVGGTPEPVEDGLYVLEDRLTPTEVEQVIQSASQLGWRVLAETRSRLEASTIEQFLIPALSVPDVSLSSSETLINSSVQVLLSQATHHGSTKALSSDASRLAEIARRLDGNPGALKHFSSMLMVESAEHLLSRFEEGLSSYVEDCYSGGQTVLGATKTAMDSLTNPQRDCLISLSVLQGVSAQLAGRIATHLGDSGAIRLLERNSLIGVLGNGYEKRLFVPAHIGAAIKTLTPVEEVYRVQTNLWPAIRTWAYETSRLLIGPDQDGAFTAIANELPNLRKGMKWGLEYDHSLAASIAVTAWRTICARGNPAQDCEILFESARVGASFLPDRERGEVWTGVAVALSIVGNLEVADVAFQQGINAFEAMGSNEYIAWASMNYAVYVVAPVDKPKALQILKRCWETASKVDLRSLAMSEYALVLALSGGIDDAVRVAEEAFALRFQSNDPTTIARAYVDLGELYQVAGRTDTARPLLLEGIDRLREAGIQNMLLDQLIAMAGICLNDALVDWPQVGMLLDEAHSIASRIGAKRQLLNVARLRLMFSSRLGDRRSTIAAVEELFRLVQVSHSRKERELALVALADELDRHQKSDYANAVHFAMGNIREEKMHSSWSALLAGDSHPTVCVLAVVMAKEALASL